MVLINYFHICFTQVEELGMNNWAAAEGNYFEANKFINSALKNKLNELTDTF